MMQLARRSIFAAGVITSLLSIAVGTSADAQPTTPQASDGLEEIVVTARKRAESLVDVPLSITVISEAMIETTGLNAVADLANQAPGLSFRPAFGRVGSGQGGGSSNRPTLRGQSNILGLPNVGFFVDGIYVSGNITSYQLDNVERIEVIRGPQSALFGRGTFAGAINFVTRQPGDELSGKIEATVGGNHYYEATGFVNGPLIDGTLSGELSLRYYDRGGDWYNRATDDKDGGKESTRSVGVKLYWTPSSVFDLEFNAAFAQDLDGTFAASYSGINCFLPVIVGAVGATPVARTRSRGYFCGEVDVDEDSSFFSRTDILRNLGLHGVERETLRSSVKLNYSVNDWTLSAIGAYNEFSNEQSFDIVMDNAETTLRPIGLSANQDRRKDWSLEFRIDSPRKARWRGTAGAYYYRENDGRGYRGAFTLPMTGGVPLWSNVVALTYFPTQDDSAVRNWSAFGLLEFAATDRLRLTAEARYQIDTIISDQSTEVATNTLLENDFKKFLPRATALFELNDDWNLFGNVALGNKPGNFNRLPADADAASLAVLQSQFQTYDEESSTTYEIGIKGATGNRKVSVNTSIYLIDWKKQQLTQTFTYTRPAPQSPNTSNAIRNAGETRIKGLEIDINVKPIDRLSLRLAYTFVDSEILDFIDFETEDLYDTDGRVGALDLANDPNGQTAGAQLPQAPKHQLILAGDYRGPLTRRLEGFLRADFTRESKRYDQVHNLAHTGASKLLNVRTGIANDAWTVTLWVENALDDRTPASLTRLVHFGLPILIPSAPNPAVNQLQFVRDILVTLPRKRSYGVTANYKF